MAAVRHPRAALPSLPIDMWLSPAFDLTLLIASRLGRTCRRLRLLMRDVLAAANRRRPLFGDDASVPPHPGAAVHLRLYLGTVLPLDSRVGVLAWAAMLGNRRHQAQLRYELCQWSHPAATGSYPFPCCGSLMQAFQMTPPYAVVPGFGAYYHVMCHGELSLRKALATLFAGVHSMRATLASRFRLPWWQSLAKFPAGTTTPHRLSCRGPSDDFAHAGWADVVAIVNDASVVNFDLRLAFLVMSYIGALRTAYDGCAAWERVGYTNTRTALH